MSWLGRLLGKDPPRIPAGGRAFVSDDLGFWRVRVAMPGEEPTPKCKPISPPFLMLADADRWLAWVNGGPKFEYPEGAA